MACTVCHAPIPMTSSTIATMKLPTIVLSNFAESNLDDDAILTWYIVS